MLSNSSKIKRLQDSLEELEKIKDMFYSLEDRVMAIETAASELEESMPSDEEIALMKDGLQKEQMLKVLELARDVYALVDEILGPPAEQFVEDGGTAPAPAEVLTPQAHGNDGLSLEAAIYKFIPGGKTTVS